MAVQQEDRSAVERWRKGEKVLAKAAEEAQADVEAGVQGAGASLDEINALMDRRDAAREQIRKLNDLGREHLEHFDKISKSQIYTDFLNNNLHAVWNGAMELDDTTHGWSDESVARNFTAMKRAYRQVLADNPKVIEAAKRAGQKETEERVEAAMAASGPSGTSKSSAGQSDEPGPKTPEQELIDRMVNARPAAGRPFASMRLNKPR
jgi:hypothetical protein